MEGKSIFLHPPFAGVPRPLAGGEAGSTIPGTGSRGAPIDTCVRLTSKGRQLWKVGLASSVGVAVEPAVMGMSLGCLHAARASWVFATHRMACGN